MLGSPRSTILFLELFLNSKELGSLSRPEEDNRCRCTDLVSDERLEEGPGARWVGFFNFKDPFCYDELLTRPLLATEGKDRYVFSTDINGHVMTSN